MLIVSKHNDYYDGLSKQYLDKSIVYNRLLEIINVKDVKINSEIDKILTFFRLIPRYGSYNSRDKKIVNHISPILVGYCGSFYLIYKSIDGSNIEYLRDANSAINKFKYYYHSTSRFYIFDDDKKIKNAFNEVNRMKNDNVFIELNCPYFSISRDDTSNINEYVITKNSILKDIQFQSIKDTFTCFQDVQTYISNILVKKEIDTKIADIDLLHSKGFDKYSFRKEGKVYKPNK